MRSIITKLCVRYRICDRYAGLKELIEKYWKNYGGQDALLKSPYLHLAAISGVLFFPYQSRPDDHWWNLPIDILPSIIGFSLGGYAIFLAIGDEKFKNLMGGYDETNKDLPSPFIALNTAFLHFILVQIAALILAIISRNLNLPDSGLISLVFLPYSIFSFFVFFYALYLAAATALELYRLSRWYDIHIGMNKE